MSYLRRANAYLSSLVTAVNSLAEIATSDELKESVGMQYKIIVELLKLERETSDFILEAELDAEFPNAVATSKQKFVNINKLLIKHLEKIQSQGYYFEELIHTLKLENETLEKEIHFL